MHQNRRTHNAHNETQRRLAKLLKQGWNRSYPHYNIAHYNDDGSIKHIEPNWDYQGCDFISVKIHASGRADLSLKDLENAKKHRFYAVISKSRRSYWSFAKKRLHRIWRRKSSSQLTYTYKDAKGCSLYDLYQEKTIL